MSSKTLRILDYAWHQAHSYRLHALPAQFWFVKFRPKVWDECQRPRPANFMGALDPDDLDIHAGDYDLALMHLDEWCADVAPMRAIPFRRMSILAHDIPRIVIMHGTPDNEANRKAMLRLIGDLPVVCNSEAAADEWYGGVLHLDCYGLPQFRAIIHGYDVDEFWSEPVGNRAVEVATICSGGHVSRIYHGIPLLERLMRDVPIVWYGPYGNRQWLGDYGSYRAMLAQTLIYFSPTRRAPMPGSRSEAMLAGCCIVTVPGQDVEKYIEHGRTGFIVESYTEARDVLRTLLANPEMAWKVGQAGRESARQAFGKERYVADWLRVLGEIGVSV